MTLKGLPVLRFVKTAPLASFVLSFLIRMLDSFLFSKIIKQRRPVTLKELPVLRFVKTAPPASFVCSLLKRMLDSFLFSKILNKGGQ